MPKPRAKHLVGFRGATIAVLLALGALTIWYATAGRSAGRMEEFMSYKNLTSFTDEQVWEAYRFALANPSNMLNFIPCFCGCVYHGDSNNHECYIDRFDAQGRPVFDPHAAGCTLCVAITREVMELAGRGIPLPLIRTYVDEKFGGAGPGTNTPLPSQ